ncbi:PAS domain-containing sensor histidine kinase [Noviherbaspirillum pedocola]|uniref:PAS domain-containing protein n=1 Tax=Noviherbaspirillum pedocola TaxID=2801341 RepID=A0A934SXM8_9BURK|nr:PAS domain-containing protein [Noviherbaspirillum pedocola]MBK4734762.1 PAS domain-containing protein [Noviherbaspirillum pedocola]
MIQSLETPTAIVLGATLILLAASIAVMATRPWPAWKALLNHPTPAGGLLRRSMPRLLVLMLILNLLIWMGERQGLYRASAAVALLSFGDCALAFLAFWRTAGVMDAEYRQRMRNASDLAEATSLLMAIGENASDPIFVTDTEGRLVFANPAMLRLMGLTREAALQHRASELFADAHGVDMIERDAALVMRDRASVSAEHTLRLPEGERTYLTSKSPWLDSEGRLRGVIGIGTDISERKAAENSLRAREANLEETIARRTEALRNMADHLETVREEEKRAIARELHDDMGAALTSLSMHLEGTYELFPDEPKWAERRAKIQSLLQSVVKTTRRIQTELRPTMLDLFGIKAAIHELADDFTASSGIACETSLPDEDITIGHKREIALYRMLQEMLNNVVKHAHATRVNIVLDVDEDRIALAVRDNGVGITPQQRDNASTYGLRGLHERAAFMGGTVRIAAGQNGGTTVAIELPLADNASRPIEAE